MVATALQDPSLKACNKLAAIARNLSIRATVSSVCMQKHPDMILGVLFANALLTTTWGLLTDNALLEVCAVSFSRAVAVLMCDVLLDKPELHGCAFKIEGVA